MPKLTLVGCSLGIIRSLNCNKYITIKFDTNNIAVIKYINEFQLKKPFSLNELDNAGISELRCWDAYEQLLYILSPPIS